MQKVYLCLIITAAILVCSPIAMAAVPVTDGLVLQLDTSDINTTESGSVTSWNDQSGNNNDAVQATGSCQPILAANITPSLGSAVKFDGTNDYLGIVPNSTLDGGIWTMFAVYSLNSMVSSSGANRIVNLGYADIEPNETVIPNVYTYSMIAHSSVTGIRATSRTTASGFISAASGVPTGYATGRSYIGALTIDSVTTTDVNSYLFDGITTMSGLATGSTAIGSGNNVARIGAGTVSTTNSGPANYFDGYVSEILIYNRVLTSEEIDSVKAYLYEKHLMAASASYPDPANAGSAYDQSVNLEWTPFIGATSQKLYFSTDYSDVNDSNSVALKATLAGDADTYGVTDLKLSTKYYWRVNHVVGSSTVPGTVWSFSLPDFYRVDDFEDYIGTGNSSIAGSLRYVWKDGWSLPTGSKLGSFAVLVDKTVGATDVSTTGYVNTLKKSMLFAFDNTGTEIEFAYPAGSTGLFTPAHPYAEVSVSLASLPIGANWTVQGDWNLILSFYGKTTNSTNSPLYLVLEDALGHVSTPVVYPTSSDIAVAEWHTWEICPGDLATNGVDLSNLSKLYIGFGNRVSPQVGGSGTVYFDDIILQRTDKLTTDFNHDCKVDFLDFNILALDWLMHAGCSN